MANKYQRGRYLVLLLLMLLPGCSLSKRGREERPPAVATKAPAASGSIHLTKRQVTLAGLETVPVEARAVTASLTAVGRVRARLGGESQVFSPFPGRVIVPPTGLPQIGSRVKKGQLLAQVEQQLTAVDQVQFSVSEIQLQSDLEQAQSEVRLTRAELDRSKTLYEAGLISLQQMQEAEFRSQQAQARLDSAKKAKARYEAVLAHSAEPRRAEIRSPLSGVIVAADLTPGEQIDTTRSLLTIADLSRVWVEAAVFETDLALVRHARQARILTPADPDDIFIGHLVTIGDIVDPANRTVTVTFAVANRQQKLKLGMFVEVRIPTGQPARAFVLPAPAVLQEAGRSFIYVETGPGLYQRRDITIGQREGDKVIVTAGVNAGERVVTVGAETLRSEAAKEQIPGGDEG